MRNKQDDSPTVSGTIGCCFDEQGARDYHVAGMMAAGKRQPATRGEENNGQE
jgi:hypothetical protein